MERKAEMYQNNSKFPFHFLPHLTGEWFLLIAKDTHIDTVILYFKYKNNDNYMLTQ